MTETRDSIRGPTKTRDALRRPPSYVRAGTVPRSSGKALSFGALAEAVYRLQREIDEVVAKVERGGEGKATVFDGEGNLRPSRAFHEIRGGQARVTVPSSHMHVSGGDVLLDNNESISWKDTTGAKRDILTYDSSNGLDINNPNASFARIRTNGSERIRVTSGGNVGINETVPAALLDVNGTAIFSGNVSFEDIAHFSVQSISLGSGVTTFAITTNLALVTPDSGGNTIADITGYQSGQILILDKVGANSLTLTDNGSGATADQFHLSADWTPGAGDILVMVHNSNHWKEISRVNNS